MQQQITGYVCQWRHAEGGFSAHVTTHSEYDLRLWTTAALSDAYRERPQWLRLRGVLIGHWLIATATEPARPSA